MSQCSLRDRRSQRITSRAGLSRLSQGCRMGRMSGLDLLPEDKRRLYVDGVWSEAEGGSRFDVLDPADGSVLASVADGTTGDARRALDAAAAAQPEWARTPPRERGELLRSAFE